jgi:hypothetical protein
MEIFFAAFGFLTAALLVWARPHSSRTRWYDKRLEESPGTEVQVRFTSPDGDVLEWRLKPASRQQTAASGCGYFQSKPMLVATNPNSRESFAPAGSALSSANSICAEAPPRALALTSRVNIYSPALR